MMDTSNLRHLGIRIPKKLDEEIENAVARGDYATKSDLVRTALRDFFKNS